MTRKKILFIFGILYSVFALTMYFGLKYNLQKKFSEAKLKEMMSGKSTIKDSTNDLCKYQVLGDPKEVGNYVKVEISCKNGKKSNNTLSLSAMTDKTVSGFMREYSRIIGFDEKLFEKENIVCRVDGKVLTEEMKKNNIRPTSTISCVEK